MDCSIILCSCLARDLKPGAFSENLTVSGAIETEVCVGDVFRIGEAKVQVSQPRMPCAKLAGKNGSKEFGNKTKMGLDITLVD